MNVTYDKSAGNSEITLNGRSVCIVDDDSLYRGYLSALLGQAHIRTLEASDSFTLVQVLEKEMPDCILLDYNLDAENGFRLHEQLKLRFPHLAPVVMLSADESQRTAIKAFRMGFYDFLPKRNLRLEEITAIIQKTIIRHDSETARHDEVSALRKNAMFDDLTGMYCRDELDTKLAHVAKSADKLRTKFAIFSICLADYQTIGTNYGIANADEILRSFAGKIRTTIRTDDFCGRFDEDSFRYVMDRNASEANIIECQRRLTEKLTFSHHLKSVELRISPLIGVSISSDHNDLAQMMQSLAEQQQQQLDALRAESGPNGWSALPDGTSPASTGVAEAKERRKSVRMRTLKPAFIALEEWSSKINCTVRNISEGGARIRLDQPLALPEYFLLKITSSGPLRRVRKCWHINDEIGVEFCDEPG
ncbi:diguanylate cyclase [Hoeflea sp.]|uniref:diguanylate cyclase domain-containing protein n=1 Tax=Hoeflea sp. TaxID=1940281 RepID=UPI002AFFA0F8|nr:diguanylate cyclase [Hoeflea sp.]